MMNVFLTNMCIILVGRILLSILSIGKYLTHAHTRGWTHHLRKEGMSFDLRTIDYVEITMHFAHLMDYFPPLFQLKITSIPGCLQLMRHCATHTWHLFMISTRSLFAQGLSALILSNHHLLKKILRSSSGENLWSTIRIQLTDGCVIIRCMHWLKKVPDDLYNNTEPIGSSKESLLEISRFTEK